MSTSVLTISGLHARVDSREILRGIDLEVKSGEIHAVMGPNGSGKSTLAHVLMGRPGYEVTSGTVTLDGVELLGLEPFGRARAGLFLTFQYPIEVPGVPLAAAMARVPGRLEPRTRDAGPARAAPRRGGSGARDSARDPLAPAERRPLRRRGEEERDPPAGRLAAADRHLGRARLGPRRRCARPGRASHREGDTRGRSPSRRDRDHALPPASRRAAGPARPRALGGSHRRQRRTRAGRGAGADGLCRLQGRGAGRLGCES